MDLWRCFYPPLHTSILKWIQSSYEKHRYQRCSIYIGSACKSIFSERQMYLSSKLLCFKLWLLNTHFSIHAFLVCESENGIRYSCLLAQTHWFPRHIVIVSQTGVLCNDAIRNGLNCNDILLLLWEINWLEKADMNCWATADIYILCSYVKQILWQSKFPSSSDRITLEKLGKSTACISGVLYLEWRCVSSL